MESLAPIRLEIAKKLEDKAYRSAYFRAQAQDDIATQIRALRGRVGFTQAQLAERCGMKQSAISRIEQADYSGWTFSTLWRIADALDSRLRVLFEPAHDVIAEYARRELEERPALGGGVGPMKEPPKYFRKPVEPISAALAHRGLSEQSGNRHTTQFL